MLKVIVGVCLTALLGGLLVPTITTYLSGRRERFEASRELFEALAGSLWTYWKLAMRVAYYGSKGRDRHEDYLAALATWESSEAWDNGGRIQIQVSRAKRLLPEAMQALDEAQRGVVKDLNDQVETLRITADATSWKRLYISLYNDKRNTIQDIIGWLDEQLNFAKKISLVRWWLRRRGKVPKSHPTFTSPPDGPAPSATL